MRSERNVGSALCEAFSRGDISRQQIVVCTKGGFLSFDTNRPANPRKYIQDTYAYVDPGIFDWADFVGGCHCMTPAYIKDQVREN
jgi:aryl-alcohol dehydrogenase-like predicted oxidoreductase